jgi:hypothetical protein
MAADLQKMEMIRRACFGNLRTLCQHRYGRELPDDDAGRETLFDLLVVASLARVDPAKKMTNVVELQAPWLDGETETMIGNVERMPVSERWRIARTLGEHHQVTYAEHRRFELKNITPCDKTKEELAEHRKARKREREKLRRQRSGAKSRSAYLIQFANSINKTKPWEALGISKASYYRQKREEKKAA